ERPGGRTVVVRDRHADPPLAEVDPEQPGHGPVDPDGTGDAPLEGAGRDGATVTRGLGDAPVGAGVSMGTGVLTVRSTRLSKPGTAPDQSGDTLRSTSP